VQTRLATASRALFWALMAMSAYFAFAPASPEPAGQWGDKLAHLLAFAALALSAAHAYAATRMAITAGLLCGWGATIEAIQALLPTRSAELGDLLADALGIAAGLAGAAAARRWLGRGG
jgi:VanZ family protein